MSTPFRHLGKMDAIDYAIFGGFCWLVYQAYSVYFPFLWNLLP